MQTNKNSNFKFYFISFIAILLVSFVVLLPSFRLAFQDDDWRGVVLPKTDYANGRLMTPYGIQLWFCGVLYDFFDSNFYLYYILSFILRNLTALGILIFLYTITKNRLASFLGGLMVAVGFSGLQTTFETASTNVYFALIGYTVFLTSFFKTKDRLILKHLIIMDISLALATLASPVRSYPLYAWAFIVDGIYLLMRFKRERVKNFLVRQSIILMSFLILYKAGIFNWFSLDAPATNHINDFGIFISKGKLFLEGLDFNIVLNFIRGLGNIVIPSIWDKSGVMAIFVGSSYIVLLIALLFFIFKKRDEKIFYIFTFLFWPPLLYFCYFVVILSGYENLSKGTVVLESFRRYLLPPFIGFVVFLAILLSLEKTNKRKHILIGFILLFIFMHSFATYSFLSELSKRRDGFFMVNIWKQLVKLMPYSSLDINKTNIFYFETDGSARAIYTLDDGFILHATTLYKIYPGSMSTPDEIDSFTKVLRHTFSFSEFISFVTKGFPNDSGPIPWKRVFAFRVEGERVINIKEEVRKRLEKSLIQ